MYIPDKPSKAVKALCYRLNPDLQLLEVLRLPIDVRNQLFDANVNANGLTQYPAVLISRTGAQSIKALDLSLIHI